MKQFLLILALCCTPLMFAQEYSGMTYNIRLDVESDGENAWTHRKESMVTQLLSLDPSFFGIQEGLPHQVTYLNNSLEGYRFIGQGRMAMNKDEFSAIFYNSQKLEVLKQGTFWLSDTPKKVSKGWDAALPRICTYGQFKDLNNGNKFWVFNTHYDHIGQEAKKNSSQLILKKIRRLTKKRDVVFLIGDFNSEPNSEPIKLITNTLNDCYKTASNKSGTDGTFNGFNISNPVNKRIDYIFASTSKKLIVKEHMILDSKANQKYISDHFPVFIKFQIQ